MCQFMKVMPFPCNLLNLVDRDLPDYLIILTKRGYPFSTSVAQEIVCNVKEKLAYVALEFEQESEAIKSSSALRKATSYQMLR